MPERICLPADGVYVGHVSSADDGVERPAAISLGRRPTFYEESGLLLLEAYLLDFDGDLYGQHARGAVPSPAAGPGALRRRSTTSIAQMARDVAGGPGRLAIWPCAGHRAGLW